MKKLMLMLGVAVMAFGVQAASFAWTSAAAYGITTTQLDSLVDGQTYAAATSGTANRMSKQTAITWAYTLILTDASTSTSATLSGTPAFSSTGKISDTLSSDLVVAGKDLTYSLVFTGTYKDANNVEWTLTSNEISASWHVNDQGDIALTTAVPSQWTASGDVPEPTSGLLMLVGLSALALRRRKA